MSLETVWPALLTVVESMVGTTPLNAPQGWPGDAIKGVAEGEQFSVPQSPFAWLLNENGEMPELQGSDLEQSNWTIVVRFLAENSADGPNAEKRLMPLLEQLRALLRAHIQMGLSTVKLTRMTRAEWGYVPVNGVWYRTLDCSILVKEKAPAQYAA